MSDDVRPSLFEQLAPYERTVPRHLSRYTARKDGSGTSANAVLKAFVTSWLIARSQAFASCWASAIPMAIGRASSSLTPSMPVFGMRGWSFPTR
jgi:hypothetical protein